MLHVLAGYYWIGLSWIATGLVQGPKPFGWLKHDMPLPTALVYLVWKGTIWPVVLYRMIRATIAGEKDFRI